MPKRVNRNYSGGGGMKKRLAEAASRTSRPGGVVSFMKMVVARTLADHGVIADPTAREAANLRSQANEQRRMRQAQETATAAGGGNARAFVGKEKPYSALTRNFGRSVMKLGSNVPADVREMAMQAAAGKGHIPEAAIQEALRGYTGASRSGASYLNKVMGRMRKTIGNAARVGMQIDMAQRGGVAGGLAAADLSQQVVDAGASLAKNKTVEKIAVAVADKVASNPGLGKAFLNAIGRGLRLGGAIGVAGQAVSALAEEYIDNQRRGSEAQLRGFRATRNMDPESARAMRGRVSSNVRRSQGMIARAKSFWGFTGGEQEEIAERQANFATAINRGASAPGIFGINPAKVRMEIAKRKGKGVTNVTDLEVEQAIKARITTKILNDKGLDRTARSKAEAEGINSFWSFLARSIGGGGTDQKKAEIEAIREDLQTKDINLRVDDFTMRKQTIARARANMTDMERLNIDRQIHESQLRLAAKQQRHKVKWDD